MKALGESGSSQLAASYDRLLDLLQSGDSQSVSFVDTGSGWVPAGDTPGAEPAPKPSAPSKNPPSQNGEPAVQLSAPETVVKPGSRPQLTWQSSSASQCTASGGWSGSKATSGTERLPAIREATTYTLTCEGDKGTAMAMMAVEVTGKVTVRWKRPKANVDGSSLSDLAGYRIYYGPESGDYSELLKVENPNASQQTLELPSGEYYVAMTAVDRDGKESAYSNEVVRTVD